MPYKDKQKHSEYCAQYYRDHPELKKVQTDRKRMSYWRKLIVKFMGEITDRQYNELLSKTEEELKQIAYDLRKH